MFLQIAVRCCFTPPLFLQSGKHPTGERGDPVLRPACHIGPIVEGLENAVVGDRLARHKGERPGAVILGRDRRASQHESTEGGPETRQANRQPTGIPD